MQVLRAEAGAPSPRRPLDRASRSRALSRADPELADAIEQIGSRIARVRLDAGEKRHERRLNAKDDAPARQIAGPAASADIREGEAAHGDESEAAA